jgi:hypothetical protein
MQPVHPPDTVRFPKLSAFVFYGIYDAELMRILGHVGHQLRTLRLVLISEAQVQLDGLLDACPQLEELSVHFGGLQSVTLLRPDTLRNLQKLRVNSAKGDFVQPGLLLQVLRMAKDLRSVDLSMVDVDVHDLQELAVLAGQGTCMQNLQHVQIILPPEAAQKKDLVEVVPITAPVFNSLISPFLIIRPADNLVNKLGFNFEAKF